MPKTISEIQILQAYIQGVMERTEHHANNVDEICLAIAGAVIWSKTGDIKVFQRKGEMKNILWVEIKGNTYAFTYAHETGTIDIKEGSTQGNVVASFDDDNTAGDVKVFFANL